MINSTAVLGSTGSIGVQSLQAAEKLGLKVTAIAANTDYKKAEQQIRKFRPSFAAMADEKAADELKIRTADTGTKILSGADGVCFCAAENDAETVIDAIVGLAGLKPALAVLKAGKQLALANKEALVAGGRLVLQEAERHSSRILPVDSEHSAIFQCLQGCPENRALKKIILTASGGPFFGKSREELKGVTAADALKHPTWNMGGKITIDSATMFNKGLEIIEAAYLFGVSADNIDILVHRESIVHSMIQYDDNSVIAQLGMPDMRLPIQYALTYPERLPSMADELRLEDICTLSFYKPDYEVFECIDICKRALKAGDLYPAAVNGANEEANKLFREGKTGFTDIARLIKTVFDYNYEKNDFSLDDIFSADAQAREIVRKNIYKG